MIGAMPSAKAGRKQGGNGMQIQPAVNIQRSDLAAGTQRAEDARRLAQPSAPQQSYQPPEVERMKSARRSAALRAPETGKGTVVDIMG